MAPGFEALPSGPTALVNLSRRPDGSSEVAQLVGDYKNPILKPEAAETVRKRGEESKRISAFTIRATNAGKRPAFRAVEQRVADFRPRRSSHHDLSHGSFSYALCA